MKRSIRSMTTLLAMLGLATGLSACAPSYGGFECSVVNDPPSTNRCSERAIVVAQGEAMVIRVRPESDTREEYEDPDVELRSSEQQTLDIRPGVGGDHTLIGLTVGEVVTEVWIDGELVDEVTTSVVESEPSF